MEQKNEIQEGTGSNHTSNQIEVDCDSLISSLTTRIEGKSKPPSQCFIFKVPTKFRSETNKDTYEPRVVSIGPYHCGKENFKTIEELKITYLKDFISRNTTSSTVLKKFFEAITEVVVDARDCYAQPFNLGNSEFVQMMVLDGCFILELFLKYSESFGGLKKDEDSGVSNDECFIIELFHKFAKYFTNKEKDKNPDRGVAKNEDARRGIRSPNDNDPILRTTWMIYSLRKDLVLLENQLPFIVLERLFALILPQKSSLNELVMKFFNPILPTMKPVQADPKIESKHILDLLRWHLIASSHRMEYGKYPFWEYTHSATDLRESGVKLRKKDPADLLDITFNKGVLEIPPFFFGESWTILLPNLIALEQCRTDYSDQITSYVILMDNLLNSQNDVKLLRRRGIIAGLFRDNEKVAEDINNLVKGAVVDKFYYDGLCSRMNDYCQTNWHKWRATFMRDYMNTPWAPVSFIGAVVLLILTLLQTIFTIRSDSNKSSS